ncbi:glycosyltransferase family 32 protein [Vagococcus sp.]|uniref:glycosyltransferase family 32 protein n=1 Tax=Vagococcus sp. TaxID=1933889 RepID=UPI003F966A7A
MIPKKIHYCWFGNNKLPETVEYCINSWKQKCPDYEIIQWNESNYDVNKIKYIKEAYSKKKYAFVSDYARLDIVYNHGGIYLDTDVELIKNLDAFLDCQCFMGLELPGRVNTGLGFGAIKKSNFIKNNMKKYEDLSFIVKGKIIEKTCVEYTLECLAVTDFNSTNKKFVLEDIIIYPTDYFCPLSMKTNKLKITNNTVSIHHYNATWVSGNKKIKKKLIPLKILLRNIIDNLFGQGMYDKIKKNIKY